MREKKRYMAYEMMSEKPLPQMADTILIDKINQLFGVFTSAKAGVQSVKYNPNTQRGLIRVDRDYVDYVRSSFVMIKKINDEKVLTRTLRVSGMLNKAAQAIDLTKKTQLN